MIVPKGENFFSFKKRNLVRDLTTSQFGNESGKRQKYIKLFHVICILSFPFGMLNGKNMTGFRFHVHAVLCTVPTYSLKAADNYLFNRKGYSEGK